MSDKKNKAVKALGFFLCSAAFTKRNVTSIFLVIVFFFVFVLAGGRIETEKPKSVSTSSFGTLDIEKNDSYEPTFLQGTKEEKRIDPESIIGEKQAEERRRRESASHITGRIFTNEDAGDSLLEDADESGLIEGRHQDSRRSFIEKRALQRSTRPEEDPLAAIEERLRQNKK